MKFTLNRNTLFVIFSLVWVSFITLFLLGQNPFQLENILGIISLAVCPGMFTLLALRMKELPMWISLAISVAFSLFELMLVALIGNLILPILGITAPLDSSVLIIETSILFFSIMTIAWMRLSEWSISLDSWFRSIYPHQLDFWASFLPVLLVAQSIAGAFSLNNGGSNMWTLAMLGEAGALIVFLVVMHRKLTDNTVATALSLTGLALLLMTSMRGWDITGHDVQREYQVFMITKTSGFWSMAAYRDAYNACLSITILPTIFSALLRFSDVYIFKFLFQTFFALVPGIVYLLNRYWLRKEYAILATVYLIGFPTFFLDMPFLVRQEIAFLFYGLMLYILFEKKNSIFLRRTLFLIFGAGVVLSHYSTTYTVILVMILVAVCYPLFLRVFLKFLNNGRLMDSSLALSIPIEFSKNEKQLTLWMVVLLMLMSFAWTSLVTKTGSSVTRVISDTLVAVKDGFVGNNRSIDVVSLISFKSVDQQSQLNAYIEKKVLPLRESSLPGEYFEDSKYNFYSFKALPDEKLPPTYLSNIIDSIGVDTSSTVIFFGQIMAKLMEVLAIIGLFYVFFKRKYIETLNTEIYLLAISSFVFIAMNIVLPVLSTEYGIYRALLQSMFIIGFLIVVATAVVGEMLVSLPSRVRAYLMTEKPKVRTVGVVFPLTIAIIFFFYSTAFIPQVFGGNTPLLHLNNSGRYYDNYLVHNAGKTAVDWLFAHIKSNSDIQNSTPYIEVDHSAVNQFAAVGKLPFSDGIFPGIVRQESFVFVTQPTFSRKRSTIRYAGDQVVYSYPMNFLDDNKNLLYNNGSARIYK